MKTPIIYDGLVEVRFSELDPYGHVNSKHFLDYVISTRWTYAEKTLNCSAGDLIKKGLGFFLKRSEMNYKRPIPGGVSLYVSSLVAEIQDSSLIVKFQIQDTEKKKIFSDGDLHFSVMDLTTMRPQALPEWAHPFFFK